MSRVLVIDDHPIVLQGVRHAAGGRRCQPDYSGINSRRGFPPLPHAQARRDYRRSRHAHRGAGWTFLHQKASLHDQQTPILVLTMHSDPVIVSRALEVGATGCLLKDTSSDEVLKAFQRVRENRPYLSHDLASEVAFMEARGTTNPLRRMTVRELQTLALVAEGKPYGVIAENLHVSYKTVANTCTQLKAKLGVRTLPELMRIAIQHLPSATAKVPRD
jgi:two-component system invasion response regulator UvrY